MLSENLLAASPEANDSLQALQQLQRLTQGTRSNVEQSNPQIRPQIQQQNQIEANQVTIGPTPGQTLPMTVQAPVLPPPVPGQIVIQPPPAIVTTPAGQLPPQQPIVIQPVPTGNDVRMQSVGSVEAEDAIEEAAFKAAIKETFPLSPEQIIRLRQAYNSTRLAEASEPNTPPKPIATSQLVNLSPGATPPVIRLSQGFVSSLVFLDSTGAPWPIAAYDLGNPSAFNIQWDRSSNALMIQAMKLYTYGNMAVRLVNLNTPVMLTLIPGQKAVDYRVDLRIQGLGPNAKVMPTGQGLPPGANTLLLKILDGVAPPGARVVSVSGGEAQAWVQGDKLFLRTQLTILSPGWIGTMESGDGMRAYEMPKTPVLLVSDRGKILQLKIEGL